MKSSAENKRFLFGLNTSRIFKFYYLSFYWKSSNLKIWRLSKNAPNLSVSNDLRYFLYTLLPHVFIPLV
jgi:hypothetical protein